MNKLAKYCSACRKSFNEDFSFCPNCAAALFTPISNQITDSFGLTFVEQKSSRTRDFFMIGAAFLVMSSAVGGVVGSIYSADLNVSALDDSLTYLANINNENPLKIEELELPQNRKKGKGAGGGGGGRKDKEEVSKGELPPQFKEKPLLTPSKEDISVSNPAFAVTRATKGPEDIVRQKKTTTNGLPNSTYEVSSNGSSDSNLGMGRDGEGGIGNRGRNGVGNLGDGGVGNNKGDKYGDRIGDSEDAETDRIRNRDKEDIPPKIKEQIGETAGMKIIAKPRAIYTNEARKNQRAGTVVLRVTFMANGSIGNVTVISGLPDGLTENAIAAAKNIQFEPAKRNGVAQTVTRQVEYTYTLY
jgi:TonB family protein